MQEGVLSEDPQLTMLEQDSGVVLWTPCPVLFSLPRSHLDGLPSPHTHVRPGRHIIPAGLVLFQAFGGC